MVFRPLVDPGGRAPRTRGHVGAPNSLIFMQFSVNKLQNNMLAPPTL